MRQAAGQLRGQFAFMGLGQRRPRLRLFRDIGGEQIAADDLSLRRLIWREGGADAPPAVRLGKLQHTGLAGQGAFEIRRQPCGGTDTKRLAHIEADHIFRAPGQDLGEAVIGIGIDPVAVHMGDMGRRHLGGEADARLHLGQPAFGLFKLRIGGGQFAIGLRQLLGMGQELIGQFFGMRAEQFLLPFDLGDIGIDGHPSAVGQGGTLDADRATVGALALHVMRHEGARLLDPVADEPFGILHLAIFAMGDEIADRVFETGARCHQMLRQAKHRAEGAIADRQAEIGIIDRQRLLNQVQTRARHLIG